jgi:hypothetical protein
MGGRGWILEEGGIASAFSSRVSVLTTAEAPIRKACRRMGGRIGRCMSGDGWMAIHGLWLGS